MKKVALIGCSLVLAVLCMAATRNGVGRSNIAISVAGTNITFAAPAHQISIYNASASYPLYASVDQSLATLTNAVALGTALAIPPQQSYTFTEGEARPAFGSVQVATSSSAYTNNFYLGAN